MAVQLGRAMIVIPVLRGAPAGDAPEPRNPCEIIAACAYSLAPNGCWPEGRSGPAGRGRLQPGFGGSPVCATSPTSWPAHDARPDGDLRPAARIPIRRPGKHDRDRRTRATSVRRVPVYSLYSETREPTAAMLDGLDVLVIDLQDVGTRIYTYIYTMANCLTACRKHGVKVIVCDRPNPDRRRRRRRADARATASNRSSAMYPIPMRHGMTIGELARLFNDHFGIGADLEVVQMEGWRREAYHDDTGRAVGDALAEHPDARLGDRVSGHGAVRGHQRVGRTRHDAAVRAARRAGRRRRAVRRRR